MECDTQLMEVYNLAEDIKSTYFMLIELTFDLFDVISDWLLLFYDFLCLQKPCKDIFKVILIGRKVNRGRAGHTVLTGGATD